MSDSAGAATDSEGRAAPDPTKNVLDLVKAAILRQDDLREMAERSQRRESKMRAKHASDLRRAESLRIDAIRAVDVAARQADTQAAEARANTLAAQVALQAEAVRTTLAAALDPIQKDIADLRRSQYEAQGKGAGLNAGWAYLLGGVAALGTVVAVLVAVLK